MSARIETGVVRFGEDWPGYFLRGKHAFVLASTIRVYLQDSNPIARIQLAQMALALERTDVSDPDHTLEQFEMPVPKGLVPGEPSREELVRDLEAWKRAHAEMLRYGKMATESRDEEKHGRRQAEARTAELEKLLKEALLFVHVLADGDETYGAFHGGDPREFCPDPEASTEDELKRHRDACDAWSRGERPEPSPERRVGGTCDGAHSEGAAYGLGSYMTGGDENARALVTRIDAALRSGKEPRP